MARRRRSGRPSDPAAIAARRAAERRRERDPQAWGIEGAHLGLPLNAEVEVVRGPRGRVVRASRRDVFDLFHSRGRLSRPALEAVRRLQADAAILHHLVGGLGDFVLRVDSSRRGDGWSEERRAAGARIAAAMGLAGPASAALLTALMEGETGSAGSCGWRDVVRRLTGETSAEAHGAVLRAACENLAGAYATLDRNARTRSPARALTPPPP